jgi:hypothetical protein
MNEPLPLKHGDSVTISNGTRKLYGIVGIASPNYRSIMISYEGILGGFVGMVPLLWTEEEGYRDFLDHHYELEIAEEN